jgi:exosortase/archaeosortase family protein
VILRLAQTKYLNDFLMQVPFLRGALVLCAGLVFLKSAIGLQISSAISWLLAIATEYVAVLFGMRLLRDGLVLRSVDSGFAISVTQACDGLGIFAAFLAAYAMYPHPESGGLQLAKRWTLAFAMVQMFNLIRILVLLWLLPAEHFTFHIAHSYVFPLASSVLVLFLIIAMHGKPSSWRNATFWLALTTGFSVLWYVVQEWFSQVWTIPITNTLLKLLGGNIAIEVEANSQTFIATSYVTNTSPLKLASLPFSAAAFGLAMPLLLAAAIGYQRPIAQRIKPIALLLGLAPLAATFAAITQSLQFVARNNITLVNSPALGPLPLKPMGEMSLAILSIIQNTIVYANLFLLPVMALSWIAQSSIQTTQQKSNNRRRKS